MEREVIRRVRFTPYLKGHGPTFALTLWDANKWDHRGCPMVGYRLTVGESGGKRVTLFEGEDFSPGPMLATDSDESVRAIMDFLTLKPGDTDAEYFEDYSVEAMEYAEQHAEALALEVMCRFGEDG